MKIVYELYYFQEFLLDMGNTICRRVAHRGTVLIHLSGN